MAFVIWEWALWFSRIWPVPQPHDAVRAVTGAPPLDAEQLRSLADRLSIGFVLNLLSCLLRWGLHFWPMRRLKGVSRAPDLLLPATRTTVTVVTAP